MAAKYGIKTVTERATLAPRREPYWQPISKGLAVGYRVSKVYSDGIWQARWRDPATGKHNTYSLGHFSDVLSDDGKKVIERAFDQAQAAAQRWAADMRLGVTKPNTTVWEACTYYVETGLKGRPKAQADAKGSLNRNVLNDDIAGIKLSDLRKKHLKEWMQRTVDGILERVKADNDDPEAIRRARATTNRAFRILRAALNLGYSDGLCSSNVAWSKGIAFEGTTRGRTTYLTEAQTDAWYKATPEPLRAFIQGLGLTAARPGELAEARVNDFDAAAGELTLKIGKRKEGHGSIYRTIPLRNEATAFFREQAKDKLGAAYLFTDEIGRPWTKETWKACGIYAKKAGVVEATAYSIRHAAISRWLAGGLSTFEVAKLAGTSEEMINNHYGHLLKGITKSKLDAAANKARGH
ncbi:tyrosine-type recombinase/integrase [Spongiibacter tropicus]|uniref:tyrosine-type recombinase/integrase n=1 Tax=Spongiibacter tropicus TaxID=454602 RepID=UPI0030080B19